MLKAVIMDFDGVIVDTEVIWFDIYKEWFKINLHYDLTMEEFLVCVGADSDKLFKKLEKDYNIIIDNKQFVAETNQKFLDASKELPLKEGVLEFIQRIKKENILLALATSASRKKPNYHLKRLKILQYFDEIVTSEDVDKIKPSPDLFNKAIEKLGVKKEEAVIIEDSVNGLIAGNRAGIRTVVCTNDVTKHSNFTNYFIKIDSLIKIDFNKIIKNFNGSSDRYVTR
ncbi:HAD-IA family hydrolase [Heyndrickxia sporothermodurans]|uniref:HAD family hydrolase n=1 Tax=Heyndrickxia sporothermodurans TaxID=46224 RepID=UPI002E222F3C|nr:HAD-IA family hydrolase [Heyndrickxia sporothermodurans]MED3782591.1 HAD-IA family hydrolase [Heyndrickxia sporothermodurans]